MPHIQRKKQNDKLRQLIQLEWEVTFLKYEELEEIH